MTFKKSIQLNTFRVSDVQICGIFLPDQGMFGIFIILVSFEKFCKIKLIHHEF